MGILPDQILSADSVGDCGRLAVVERVVAAHEALQFGEFSDHFRKQVSLGEIRGAIHQVRVGSGPVRDKSSNRPHALYTV